MEISWTTIIPLYGRMVASEPKKRNFFTAQKVSKYEFFSGLYFHVFGLNIEIYSVTLRIQSKYGKIRTRTNAVLGLFSRSASRVLQFLVFKDYQKVESLCWEGFKQVLPENISKT